MTLALCSKTNAGIVIAADSASTITDTISGNVVNVYLNANKVFNAYKGLPVGIVTYGLGELNGSSISILVKDFRCALNDQSSKYCIDRDSYSILEIAEKFMAFIVKDHYLLPFPDPTVGQTLGFFVAGFSSNERFGEAYGIELGSNAKGLAGPTPAVQTGPNVTGLSMNGQPEAVYRLLLGFGTGLPNVLAKCGVDAALIPGILQSCQQNMQGNVLWASMPLQDLIDLNRFLIDMSIQYTRFLPGAQTIGGPIEIAAMTRHEGFKWVQRKHYYDQSMNGVA